MRREEGQTLILYSLFLTTFVGITALAIDVGNLYFVKGSFQRVADSAAMAGTSGLFFSQAEATARAMNYANLNLSTQPGLNGTPTVTFPTATSIKVTVSDPAAQLFFGGIIGIPTAAVSAEATASLEAASSVTRDMVPLAVYCNNPTGCEGILAVGQTYTARRICGNVFVDGTTCGNTVASGEVFLVGLSITGGTGTNEFRDLTFSGYPGTISIGDLLQALTGNREDWRPGMTDRLALGRNEMVVAVVRPTATPGTLEVYDFIMINVSAFTPTENTDDLTFEIVQGLLSARSFVTGTQGYGINSILGVRIIE